MGKLAARQARIERWQAMVIRDASAKMPGWIVKEPLAITVSHKVGDNLGDVTLPNGPIRIAPRLLKQGPGAVRECILHELIHVHIYHEVQAGTVPREASHGPRFQALASFFGLKNWGDNTWRYKYECRTCGYWLKTHKKTRVRCNRDPFNHGFMVRRDHVKVTRAMRAELAGRPIPVSTAKPKPPPDVMKLDKARLNLKRAETRVKRAETIRKKWVQKVRYYERKTKEPST